MRYLLQAIAVLAVFAIVVSGCKKDDATTNPTTVTHASGAYTGILAGSTTGGAPVSGVMTINVPASKSIASNDNAFALFTVTGTYTLAGGSAISYTGSYNTDNDSLLVTAGEFSFRGTYNRSTGALQGVWSTATSSGNFVAQTGSGTTVSVFLGAWNSVAPTVATGTFNMAVKGNVALGVMAYGTTKYPFTGAFTGDTVKISASYSGFTVQIAKGWYTSPAHDSLYGTYNLSAAGKTASGSWSGKKASL